MKYRHTSRIRATLAKIAGFHAMASSLKAITPPLIPLQLHLAPKRMGIGDEMAFTMWMGPLPLLFASRARRTRRLLEAEAT